MKTKMLYLMAAGFLALLSAGCEMEAVDAEKNPAQKPADGTDKGSQQTSKYTKEYWGEWLSGADGAVWYISANDITIGGGKTSKNVTLNKQSEKVIEVTENGAAYKLYASRVTNAAFTGKLAKAGGGAALSAGGRASDSETGFSAAANVPVTITSVRNPELSQTVFTNGEGEFTMTGIISGDSYTIEPEGGKAETVTIDNDGQDIGTITMVNGVNFKVRVSPWQEQYGEHLFGGRRYTITVEVENTGNEDCSAATYRIGTTDNIHINSHQNPDGTGDNGVFGTIEPGMKKRLVMDLSCDILSKMESLEKILIEITDPRNKKTWRDSVSFMIKQGVFDVNIRARQDINGVFIRPDARAEYFKGQNITLTSATSEKNFLIYFCGATALTETPYSFGIERAAPSYDNFKDLMNYEPNDTETTATWITTSMAKSVVSYLDKNDIDFYRFNLTGAEQPSSTGNESAAPEQKPAVLTTQWNGVTADGADGTADTAKLVFDFSVSMANDFTADHITLNPELSKGTLSNKGGGTYELPISGSWNNNTSVTVTLNAPAGWTITGGSQKTVTVYKKHSAGLYKGNTFISADGLENALGYITTNAAENDAYTIVLGDSEFAAPKTLSYNNKKVSVTLTGDSTVKIVQLNATGSLFTIGNGVTFTLDKNIMLNGRNNNTVSLVRVNSGGTLVMSGGTISGNTASSFSSSSSSYGGGVYVDGGIFTMSDGTINGNTASSSSYSSSSSSYSRSYGGGVYVDSGTFTMSGGTISGNTASSSSSSSYSRSYGGGVYVDSGTFTMNGGTISGNTASSSTTSSSSSSYGGGVYVRSKTFTMSGGTISGNTASSSSLSSGGGVYVDGGIFTMSGGTINGNTASSGGGVYVDGGIFTMSGGTINGNTASSSSLSYGGGVYIDGGTFVMSGGTISGNTASSSTTSSSSFSYGGGVYVKSGTFTKTNEGGVIYGNDASPENLRNKVKSDYGYGHAVYVYTNSKSRNTTINASQEFSSSSGPWQ